MDPKDLPLAITIRWDAQNQVPHATMHDAIKNPNFAIAILEMASRELEVMLRVQRLNQMQKQAQEQQFAEHVRSQVLRPH